MEAVIRRTEVETKGTVFYKSVQLLAYANDIDIIGTSKRAVTAAFSPIERESAKVGLSVNMNSQDETQRGKIRKLQQEDIILTLGTIINQDYNISLEIQTEKLRLRSKALSRKKGTQLQQNFPTYS